ncbi:DNA-binding protein [Massilia sp. TWP1-3-3]|uniref:DNA-binding protein n=1 Tax=Massilia sp. TWP1-3-3 TaxID=2804573 RepID=UPI003CEBFCA9
MEIEMGRHAAVTFEQVCAAAAALRADGTTPGAKAIRQMLGDIGSLGTIQKLL